MDSLQLSGSIDAQLESLEADRLDDLASSAGKSLQHLGEVIMQSPATVSSAVAAPLDLPVPEVMHIGHTNTHIGVGSEGLSLGTDLVKGEEPSHSASEEPQRVQDKASCPALFLTADITSLDYCVSILRFLDNAGCEFYRTLCRSPLNKWLPDCIPDGEKSSTMFVLRTSKTLEPASPSSSMATVPELDIRHVLFGNAALWECAKAAELLPQDPRDVMIAFDIWMAAMELLAKVRATKGTEINRHKNRELRWFILDLKKIEATLCQISVPGQVIPTVLGSGKLSFADYAVTRLYEVLLNDSSEHRLPYTRQKKYPKIIEIASHVMAKRMTTHNSKAHESIVDQPMGLQTWQTRVEMHQSVPISTKGVTAPARKPDHHISSESEDSSDYSSSSTAEYMREHTDMYARTAHKPIGFEDSDAENTASATIFPMNVRAEHLSYIPGIRERKNFIYCCNDDAPLRNFLRLFGEVVAKRTSQWHDVSDLWTSEFAALLAPSERTQYNFLAVYTGRKPGQVRLCWSLAEMLSHKKLYSADSLVDRASVEVLSFLLQPREKAVVPVESWVRLETALKLESEYNPLLPALARVLAGDERMPQDQYPRLLACEIRDPQFVELSRRW